MSDIAAAAILMTWQLNWESISTYMEEHDDEISNLEGIPFWRGVCDTDAHWCQSRGSFWEIAIAGHAEDDVLGLPGLHAVAPPLLLAARDRILTPCPYLAPRFQAARAPSTQSPSSSADLAQTSRSSTTTTRS